MSALSPVLPMGTHGGGKIAIPKSNFCFVIYATSCAFFKKLIVRVVAKDRVAQDGRWGRGWWTGGREGKQVVERRIFFCIKNDIVK